MSADFSNKAETRHWGSTGKQLWWGVSRSWLKQIQLNGGRGGGRATSSQVGHKEKRNKKQRMSQARLWQKATPCAANREGTRLRRLPWKSTGQLGAAVGTRASEALPIFSPLDWCSLLGFC